MFRSVHEVKADAVKLPDSPRIAMLEIDRVSASTAQELRAWEIKLQTAGVKGVILDLRNVGDIGPESYHSAVLLADSLIDGKPIGKLRTRERQQEFAADRETLFRDMPLAILVNKRTGGAAEWVAAAVQDANAGTSAKRHAVIVGQSTHGANLITSAVPVPGGQEVMMVATALWSRPNQAAANNQPADDDGDEPARSWHVTPDIHVDPPPRVMNRDVKKAAAEAKMDGVKSAAKQGEKPETHKAVPPGRPSDAHTEADSATVNAAIAKLVRQLKSSGAGK